MYRIEILTPHPDGRRQRYRGTGFNLKPAALTKIIAPLGYTWEFYGPWLVARASWWSPTRWMSRR
jgi:hypothetical protein